MRKVKVIDLHCDTLTASDKDGVRYENPLYNDSCDMCMDKVPEGVCWAQMHAVFMPDKYRGDEAIDFYEAVKSGYFAQLEQFSDKLVQCRTGEDIVAAWAQGKAASVFTVEGGSVLAGDISRVEKIANDGVKILTLVWNGENEIASGHNTDHGFSEFGKKVVPELEKHGIIVDVSHLNDVGFDDLLQVASKPFVATHSNARAICSHKRNLTDEMIREMVARDCLIGLNYYTAFISDDDDCDYADMFYRHICHFIELGAGKNLALGSDFDGAYLPDCLSSPAKVIEMYDYLLERGLSEEQLDDIYYGNALRFMKNNC